MSSLVVALNDQEFLMPLHGTDLMKYNTVNKEWTLFPKMNEYTYQSMMIDRQLNRLYLCYVRGSLIVKDLSTGLTVQKVPNSLTPINLLNHNVKFAFANANGTIHRIGGLSDHHVTWSVAHSHWNPSKAIQLYAGYYFTRVSLVYVESKNIILMLGGHAHDAQGNDPAPIGMWRFDIATSTWKHIENVTRDYSETHAVLTSDQQNVIIVGKNRIDILDIQDENDYKITRSMTLEFGYSYTAAFPVLMKRRETDVVALTSGWFRKQFSSNNDRRLNDGLAACPLDILKLIDKFVCTQMLHLLTWSYAVGAVDHLTFQLADMLSIDLAETPKPIELPGFVLTMPNGPNRRLPNVTAERFRRGPINSMKTKQCVLCFCALLVAYLFKMFIDWLT